MGETVKDDLAKKPGWIDAKVQHFMASLLFTILFPLLPLLLEFMFSDGLSDRSVLIAAVMYCSALSVASSSVWVLGLGFVASLFLSVSFGITFYNGAVAPTYSATFAWLCIVFFGFGHIFERYDLHVTKARNFIDVRSASV